MRIHHFLASIFTILALCYLAPALGQDLEDRKFVLTPTIDVSTASGVYVPIDIPDAFAELLKMLHPTLISEIRDGKNEGLEHFGIGMWIRNNWGLWSGSRLQEHFHKLGIRHPDDMSSIVLSSFKRYLRNEPLEIEDQISFYKRYWKIRARPKSIPCLSGHKGRILFAMTDDREPREPRYIHVAECGRNTGVFLIYEFDKGWYRPTRVMRSRILQLKTEDGLESAPLNET